jgi:hypothetical protein
VRGLERVSFRVSLRRQNSKTAENKRQPTKEPENANSLVRVELKMLVFVGVSENCAKESLSLRQPNTSVKRLAPSTPAAACTADTWTKSMSLYLSATTVPRRNSLRDDA